MSSVSPPPAWNPAFVVRQPARTPTPALSVAAEEQQPSQQPPPPTDPFETLLRRFDAASQQQQQQQQMQQQQQQQQKQQQQMQQTSQSTPPPSLQQQGAAVQSLQSPGGNRSTSASGSARSSGGAVAAGDEFVGAASEMQAILAAVAAGAAAGAPSSSTASSSTPSFPMNVSADKESSAWSSTTTATTTACGPCDLLSNEDYSPMDAAAVAATMAVASEAERRCNQQQRQQQHGGRPAYHHRSLGLGGVTQPQQQQHGSSSSSSNSMRFMTSATTHEAFVPSCRPAVMEQVQMLRHSAETLAGPPSLQSLNSDLGGNGLDALDAMPNGWGASDESLGAVELDLAAAVARYSTAGTRIMSDLESAGRAAAQQTAAGHGAPHSNCAGSAVDSNSLLHPHQHPGLPLAHMQQQQQQQQQQQHNPAAAAACGYGLAPAAAAQPGSAMPPLAAASLLCQLTSMLQQNRVLLQQQQQQGRYAAAAAALGQLPSPQQQQQAAMMILGGALPGAGCCPTAASADCGGENERNRAIVVEALTNATYLPPRHLTPEALDPPSFDAFGGGGEGSSGPLCIGGSASNGGNGVPNGAALPINCAALSVSCLEAAGDKSASARTTAIPPLSSEKYFSFLQSLEHDVFSHLARMVARFRRTVRNGNNSSNNSNGSASNSASNFGGSGNGLNGDSGESVIVSVNLCSCSTPHASASSASGSTEPHLHRLNPSRPETLLSVMLVELHPDLPVVEFLDRRLPAVVRQHVGNRLDRNFVVQVHGVSLLRSNLYQTGPVSWKVCDLPCCKPQDLLQLQRHPLYRHLLTDLAQRAVKPKIANLTLCPIQYRPHRPLPASAAHGRTSH